MARQLADLVVPEHAPVALVGAPPVGGDELGLRHALARGGPDQLHPLLHPAIVQHARRRRQQDGGAPGARVDDQTGLAIGSGVPRTDLQRRFSRERRQPVAADDLDQLGGRAGAGMLVERLPAGDGERVGNHGLDADLVAAGLDRLLDIGGDALLQLGEELVLLGDGQRQQPVEEPGHGRQIVLEAALVDDPEAGRLLEAFRVPALDAPAPERAVELAQCGLRIGALQVVALAEQRRIAAAHGGLRIPLATGDGAEAVEPPGDGGDEAALALHVRGDGGEQRRGGLVGAVGPAQPLDRLIGAPAGLQQVVDAPLRVSAGEIGVITAPGAAGHREHQDALLAVHERGGLGQVGGRGPAAQRQPLALRIGNSEHTPRPSRDLGDGLMPELLHDLIERRRHRRQCRQLLDQRVAPGLRFLADDRVAVGVGSRCRAARCPP